MTAKDIRPRDEVASFLAAQRSLLGAGSPGVFRHLRKDGSTLLARISEHRVELHEREAMMVMAEDVTEAVGLQDAVNRQQRQLSRVGVIRPPGVGIFRPVGGVPKCISKHSFEGAILQR
jgi:hypothetical protein